MRHLGIFGRICRLHPDQWRGFRIQFQLPRKHLEELEEGAKGLRVKGFKRLISFTLHSFQGSSLRAYAFRNSANPPTLKPFYPFTLLPLHPFTPRCPNFEG